MMKTQPARVPHRVNRRTLRQLVEHRRIQAGSTVTGTGPLHAQADWEGRDPDQAADEQCVAKPENDRP